MRGTWYIWWTAAIAAGALVIWWKLRVLPKHRAAITAAFGREHAIREAERRQASLEAARVKGR